MKLNKEEKQKRDDIVVYVTAIIFLLGAAVLFGFLVARTIVVDKWNVKAGMAESKVYTTKDSIIKASKNAIDAKRYMLAIVEQEENGSEPISATYTYRLDKETNVVSYTYRNDGDGEDNSESLLIEYWQDKGDTCDVYIWASDAKSYVKTELEEPPITMLAWDLLDNLDEYSLLAETGKYGNTQEDCYVLALYGKSDAYDVIGEYVYISKSSLLPLGIITIGSDYEEDVISYGSNSEPQMLTEEEAEEEIDNSAQSTSIVRVSYIWSNEKPNEVNLPTNVISEEEYQNAVMGED